MKIPHFPFQSTRRHLFLLQLAYVLYILFSVVFFKDLFDLRRRMHLIIMMSFKLVQE